MGRLKEAKTDISPPPYEQVLDNSVIYNLSCCQQTLAQIHQRGCEEASETVVHRLLKILLAPQISLRG